MSDKTGGSAFPSMTDWIEVDESTGRQTMHCARGIDHGMTLRDYFAAKALQGICASGPGFSWSNKLLANEAYSIAEAMLEAREE